MFAVATSYDYFGNIMKLRLSFGECLQKENWNWLLQDITAQSSVSHRF